LQNHGKADDILIGRESTIRTRNGDRMADPAAARVVLVTGASRGIGRAAALALAGEGAHVIALARTQGALEALDDEIRALGGTATLVPLDLSDHDALDRLGGSIFERWGKLDGLLGNGGLLGPITPLPHASPKQFADVFSVNVAANFRLIRSLDPLLRAAPAGRAVFVTSGAASRAATRAYWGLYASSKAALDLLARSYAAETITTAVRVMLVNPGPMRTRMRATAMPGEDPMTLPTPEDLAPKLLRLLAPEWEETGKLYDFPTDRVLTFRDPS
jgi:NAD(P)-dependent dehydrogenase (short-subunit alcohol dehydrogenase family)